MLIPGTVPSFCLDKESTSIHSTDFNSFVRATFKTSSKFLTVVTSISLRIFFGISTKSFLLFGGI